MMNTIRFLWILPIGISLTLSTPSALADMDCTANRASCRHTVWRKPAAMADDGRVRTTAVPANSEQQLPMERFTLWALPPTPETRAQVYTDAQMKPVQVKMASLHFPSAGATVDARSMMSLQRLLDRIRDKPGLHLHVIGHTDTRPLSLKARHWFKDNQALSLARAQAVADYFQRVLHLPDTAITATGMGDSQPVASNTTPQGMAKNRRVEVEVWYPSAEQDTVKPAAAPTVSRRAICRDKMPQAVNKSGGFNISVDGEPAGGANKEGEDRQRCTDVALAQTRVQMQYDNLSVEPRLDVSAWPATATPGERIHFQGYSNYLAWVDHAEVLIFAADTSDRGRPLAEITLNDALSGDWLLPDDAPKRLQYRLRVADKHGHFDETESLPLWAMNKHHTTQDERLSPALSHAVGYGKNRLETQAIPVSGGTITVNGKAVSAGHNVFFMGAQIPVDGHGSFVARQIVPDGRHTVEVAILDPVGNGSLFWRDLEFKQQDWFYMGLADITAGGNHTHGPGVTVTHDQQHLGSNNYVDGRLAFYTKGKWHNYTVTASADTREQPLDALFSNFGSKDRRSLLRRLDSQAFYPTFGDDSQLVEDAPTQGKFYARIEDERSYALWGNFKVRYQESDLAQVNRGLYGANADWKSAALTSKGENRTRVRLFAADPGTLAAREEFRGTGGTLYYLAHQDITQGSERLQVEVRDKDSGIVTSVNNLVAGQDYTLDSIQGRILLTRALPSTADDSQLVRAGSLAGSGNPVYLVSDYEYTSTITTPSNLALGGRVSQWLSDDLRIGLTGSRQKLDSHYQGLGGVDLLYRHSAETYLRVETAHTDGAGVNSSGSIDGGFDFNPSVTPGNSTSANAYQLESGFRLDELGLRTQGHGDVYLRHRDKGFSAPGQSTQIGTDQFGGALNLTLTHRDTAKIKVDVTHEEGGRESESLVADVAHHINQHWSVSTGLRADRQTSAPGSLLTTTPAQSGNRVDIAVQTDYTLRDSIDIYAFGQGTVARNGARRSNNRGGIGTHYQFNDRLGLKGEVSAGDGGAGALVGTDYRLSDRTTTYLNYALDPDNSNTGVGNRQGKLVTGARTRYSDALSVYGEERLLHGSSEHGLTHAYGVDLTPDEHWKFGLAIEAGHITTHANDLRRRAISLSTDYALGAYKYGGALEYRQDRDRNDKRQNWLMRNHLFYQLNPDWRLRGQLDFALSDSQKGDTFNADYIQAILGYAYRPVLNDRLNALLEYKYLMDQAPGNQFTASGLQNGFQQRSHVFSTDLTYDLTPRWTIGGKYAIRVGQLRAGRGQGEWFSSTAQLGIARLDWHVVRHWDGLIEGRVLNVSQARDRRAGALVAIYRHFGEHIKVGVGFNFTDFSDDLTHLSYNSRGAFINLVGKL